MHTTSLRGKSVPSVGGLFVSELLGLRITTVPNMRLTTEEPVDTEDTAVYCHCDTLIDICGRLCRYRCEWGVCSCQVQDTSFIIAQLLVGSASCSVSLLC